MFAPRGWLKRPVARRIYRKIAESDLFDGRWYRATQMSGIAKLSDPLWHYLDYGAQQGFDPSLQFDTSHYVHTNHDVRNSGLNPLFHYLEYGIAERRSPVRSVIATRDALFPESAELQTYTSPQLGSARVTLVVDSRSESELGCSLTEMIKSASEFARKKSRTLRVIVWPQSGDVENPFPGVAVISARRTHPAPTFDCHPNELFISSSSSSAVSLRHVAPLSHLWRLTARKSLSCQPWVTRPSLHDAHTEEDSPSSEIPLPRSGRIPLQARGEKKTLVVLADALARPLTYLGALEVLDNLFLTQLTIGSEWEVMVCGRGVESLTLAGAYLVRKADHVNKHQIATISSAILTTPDSQVEAWLEERGIPVLTDSHDTSRLEKILGSTS
jgi:hypothetical protein